MNKKVNNKNKKNYRMTQTRKDILECLNDNFHGHTIKDIIKHLSSKDKKVNVASVYNTIKFLVNEGIVDIYTDYKNKNQTFEIIDKNDYHIHIYDTKTSSEKKINMPNNLKVLIEDILSEKGYLAHNIKIEILGYKKDKNNS